MGPGGDLASETVLGALRPLESMDAPGDLLNALSDAVSAATSSLRELAESDPEFADSGSTLTAMLWSGSRLALVHIGDTRAYLLRDGGLFQITHDHSVVQSMIDAGRLTPEEAVTAPAAVAAAARARRVRRRGRRNTRPVAARGAGRGPVPALLGRADLGGPRRHDQGHAERAGVIAGNGRPAAHRPGQRGGRT